MEASAPAGWESFTIQQLVESFVVDEPETKD
jgi:hypothetical protein